VREPLSITLKPFRRWLHMPDETPVLATLGAVAANHLPGDPVWLLAVGPPGCGKSEIVSSTCALQAVHPAATLTEPALLSGTPKKEHGTGAKGGLLRQIGEFGIIACKDFGSVLSMHRDARSALLAALREIYDGSWTRHVGTDGGRTLHWTGKVGVIAGCTETIDRHHAVMGAMGERFVLLRMPDTDPAEQARRALSHAGRENEMRAELAAAVNHLLSSGLHEPQELSLPDREYLVSLATLVVRCRSAVERDGYSREIELVPTAEAPTRLIVVLSRLLAGLDAIGLDRRASWPVVRKVALDSIPELRRRILTALNEGGESLTTSQLGEAIRHPTNTTRRSAEDLAAHGLVIKDSGGKGNSDTWTLAEWTSHRWTNAATFPETSDDGLNPTDHIPNDISGKVINEVGPDAHPTWTGVGT
jgi:hypothetical protein